jgi:hypothetical protein
MGVALGLDSWLFGGGPAPTGAPEPSTSVASAAPPASPAATPDAGKIVEQPAVSVARYGRARFRWRGGAAPVDVPQESRPLVELQRLGRAGWRTVATDDAYQDITERGEDGVWTETFQFGSCTAVGKYRFVVHGRADRGSGPADYSATSRVFSLTTITNLRAAPLSFSRGRVSFRALYPDPGKQALLTLPRLVRTGYATLEVRRRGRRPRRIRARANPFRALLTTRLPRGARSVRVVGLRDSCGNRLS